MFWNIRLINQVNNCVEAILRPCFHIRIKENEENRVRFASILARLVLFFSFFFFIFKLIDFLTKTELLLLIFYFSEEQTIHIAVSMVSCFAFHYNHEHKTTEKNGLSLLAPVLRFVLPSMSPGRACTGYMSFASFV